MASLPDDRPTKMMLAAWALGECGGDRDHVDKLDVAVYAFKAYPEYFGFQKYPEYPDVDAVRVGLDVLKVTSEGKAAKGLKLDGNAAYTESTRVDGTVKWRLTPAGVDWWKANRASIRSWVERNAKSEFGTTKTASGKVNTEVEAKAAFADRVRGTPGFQKWIRNGDVTRHQVGLQTFFTAFGIGPRTGRPDYIKERDKVVAACAGDAQVSRFLEHLDKLFGEDYRRILTGEVKI